MRFVDRIEDAVDDEQKNYLPLSRRKSETETHGQIDSVAQYYNLRPAKDVAEPANEWRGDNKRNIKQGIEQHDILDRETNFICTQEQKTKTKIGQGENPRRDQVALEPTT